MTQQLLETTKNLEKINFELKQEINELKKQQQVQNQQLNQKNANLEQEINDFMQKQQSTMTQAQSIIMQNIELLNEEFSEMKVQQQCLVCQNLEVKRKNRQLENEISDLRQQISSNLNSGNAIKYLFSNIIDTTLEICNSSKDV